MLKYLCKRASCTRLMSFKLADKSLMSLSQVLNVIPKPLLLCTFDALPRPRVFREVVDAQKFVVAQEKARKIKSYIRARLVKICGEIYLSKPFSFGVKSGE